MLRIRVVFHKFDYQNFINELNAYDIQNPHKKLSRITYILVKILSIEKPAWGGPQAKIVKKSWGGVQAFFEIENIFH